MHWLTYWVMDPHSFWGWVLDIGSLVAAAWLVGFWLVCFVGWLLDGGSTTPSPRRMETARLNEYRNAIDALYDAAEQEVRRRITDRGHGG